MTVSVDNSKKSSVNKESNKDVKSIENVENVLERSLDKLSATFEASAHRWQAIVYPSLFAFIILASYGFYLIYNLTSDVRRVADNMDLIVINMNHLSENMKEISVNMLVMKTTMDAQSASMHEMTYQMRGMNASMSRMRYDISSMNNTVSRPMNFMNTFMPW